MKPKEEKNLNENQETTKLDLFSKGIENIRDIDYLPQYTELYLEANKITEMDGLDK